MTDEELAAATKKCVQCGEERELLRFRCPRCGSEIFDMATGEAGLEWFERALEIDPEVPGGAEMAETARIAALAVSDGP